MDLGTYSVKRGFVVMLRRNGGVGATRLSERRDGLEVTTAWLAKSRKAMIGSK